MNTLPYVPDIDRLLNTLRKMSGSSSKDWEGDDYATFWIEESAVVLEEQEYSIASSYTAMASNEMEGARNAFWKWIELSRPIADITGAIGKDGISITDLLARLTTTYPEQDTRIRVAWMERLGIVRVENGKYILNDGEIEFDDDAKEGIYPINIEDTIEIKDDKFSVFDF